MEIGNNWKYITFALFLCAGLVISLYKLITYESLENEVLDRINVINLLFTTILFYISLMFLSIIKDLKLEARGERLEDKSEELDTNQKR